MRNSLNADAYLKFDHLEQMQNLFNGNRNLTWNSLADYALYLKKFLDADYLAIHKTRDA
jgi:hypothetical protein